MQNEGSPAEALPEQFGQAEFSESAGSGAEAGSPASDSERERKRRRRRRKKRSGGGEGQGPEREPGTGSNAPRRKRKDVNSDDAEIFDQTRTFADLGLHPDLVRGLTDAGFVRPTHIQSQLMGPALEGRDVLGQAKTGTGKTAAFGLPVLSRAEPGVPFQAIILAPTRELAMQITDELNDLGRHLRVRAVTVYGGQRISTQIDKLAQGPEIIVGTPGRVLDMVGRGHLHFANVRFAVLDEVDRMFDIGFREDIRRILKQCPKERQTLVVSATISGEIEDLARRHMRDPEKIVTAAGSLTVSLVEQHYLTVEGWDKKRLLLHLLTHEEPALTLVFCRMKRRVDEVVKYLAEHGVESHAIHGDMSQSKRTSTMRKFREGQLAVLVASDLAARGIDVDGITHVVNYDLPEDPEVYVHRIGRTARAGSRGVAWTFVTRDQGKLLTEIESLIELHIPKMDYPDIMGAERPSSWRDEPTGHRPLPKVEYEPESRNRYEAPAVPAAESAEKLAAKFPGGAVPTKLPPKRLKGKVRTGRR